MLFPSRIALLLCFLTEAGFEKYFQAMVNAEKASEPQKTAVLDIISHQTDDAERIAAARRHRTPDMVDTEIRPEVLAVLKRNAR